MVRTVNMSDMADNICQPSQAALACDSSMGIDLSAAPDCNVLAVTLVIQ